MFNRKPRRNFRQRKGESSDEENEQKKGNGDVNNSMVNKPSKVAQSRGISCSSKREATPTKSDSSDEEVAQTTSLLGQTERNVKTGAHKKTATAVLSFSDEKEAEVTEFKLRKASDKAVVFQARKKNDSPAKISYNNASPASPRLDLNEPSPQTSHDDDDDDDDDKHEVDDSNEADPKTSSSNSSSNSSPASSSPVCKPVIIPNARDIQAARRQRRAAQAQKDYISLDVDSRSSRGSTPDRHSRDGEREEDDNDELDDYEKRIEFAPRLKGIRERIAEKLGSSDGSLSDSEREERELWEETQIEKGVKRHPGEQSPSGSENSRHSSSSSSRKTKTIQKKRSRVKIPKFLAGVTVSMVKRRITGMLDSLKEVHRARQAELRRMEVDVESARTCLENLEESSSEKQLRFYRAMTLYVHNLIECLQEKVVEVNSLELQLHSLLADQMEALLSQRRKAVREEAARLQQLSYSTDKEHGESSNGNQSQGVPVSVTHVSDAGAAGYKQHCDDLPEDTHPSPEEEEQLQKKMADVLSQSQTLFSDVREEFYDVKKILSRFEEWRSAYSDSYHSAYISLCLPKLLNPIIRYQLLPWNPLKDTSEDFEALPWYSAVETFCHGQGYEELEHSDRQTLPNVIEKTLLPKMTTYAELLWDPLSLHQSVCLSDICHRLREDHAIFMGEQSKPVKVFVEAVINRMRTCVDEDIFIPLYPKKFLEDRTTPQCRFRDKQFWTAVKLLTNMGKWDSLLPESVLKELILDKLLNRYLMITLLNQTHASNTVCTCKKIADNLPVSWFRGTSGCLPQLQSFSNHLVQTAHSICKEQSPTNPNTKSAVMEVLKVLSSIRSFDSIMAITDKYNYQDLIYTHQLLNQDRE